MIPVCSNPECPLHGACDVEAQLGLPERKPPADWMSGAMAKSWGKWRWDLDSFREAQRWGDSNGCRLILVSEYNETTAKHPEYHLQLYIAPKPTDRLSGMNEPAVSTRDRGMERFGPWLEGFLAGRGVIKAGERL